MIQNLQDLMLAATRLTREGRLTDAAASIRNALSSALDTSRAGHGAPPGAAAKSAGTVAAVDGNVIDGCVFDVPGTVAVDVDAPPPRPPQRPPAGTAARFTTATHRHASLSRDFKLYCPPDVSDGDRRALIVMLHGCIQDADDFARGTAMNGLAERDGFYVLYPEQSQTANPQRCWNWFKRNHQRRGGGEPALIASLTQAVVAGHHIDPSRVYVAGLSAGGAMAAIVAGAYPDVYAAAGVHSGLASGSASNVSEALAAMKGGRPVPTPSTASASPQGRVPPTIVFHGDADLTVHRSNGDRVFEDTARIGDAGAKQVLEGRSEAGKRYSRSIRRDASGAVVAEHWVIHGAGHAWSGGSPTGSYTDPEGPDASAEMLRFFQAHRAVAQV